MKKRFALTCVSLALCLGAATVSAETAKPNEPVVFMNYTQAQLDHNYSQGEWAPNIKQILGRYNWRSDITRQVLGQPQRVAYGSSKVEGFDLFRAKNKKAPLEVFIHGGAWKAGSASSYAFPAQMFVAKGVSYASLDFGKVQDIGLDGMIGQVREAIAYIYKHANELGIDPNRIYISGHSSGAHLGGVLLTTDWSKYGVPKNVIKGATLISGMYDLKAVRLSVRSKYVPFTDAIEDAMSTQRHLDRISTPVILAYGSLETDEFKRQTKDFAAAMEKAGKPVQLLNPQFFNHFEMMDDFGNPYGIVAAATLKQIAK